jgi:hypothetical protein
MQYTRIFACWVLSHSFPEGTLTNDCVFNEADLWGFTFIILSTAVEQSRRTVKLA